MKLTTNFENRIKTIAQTNENILISGELDSGKMKLATMIYNLGEQMVGSFEKLNCTGLSSEQFENRVCGALDPMTNKIKPGLLAKCEYGVLCLTGIDTLTEHAQEVLYRIISENEYYPMGSVEPIECHVRFFSIPDKAAKQLFLSSEFRADLLQLLSEQIITTKPFAERKADMGQLVAEFMHDLGHDDVVVLREAINTLASTEAVNSYAVLKNLLRYMLTFTNDNKISSETVTKCLSAMDFGAENNIAVGKQPLYNRRATDVKHYRRHDDPKPKLREVSNNVEAEIDLSRKSGSSSFANNKLKRRQTDKPMTLKQQERFYWENLLENVDGDKSKAAKIAGISLRTLYRRLDSVGL